MTEKVKVIRNDEDRANFVFGRPWVSADGKNWQPCSPNCFRVQSVDLKHNAFVVWVTNGAFHKTVLVASEYLAEFLNKEKFFGAVILDDSGIGLDRLRNLTHAV